ncbi:IS1595 family transposase [Desulfovibrio sp. JY]|nr:IS1595 family transposase [Desulfovibrio sp. JY]
MARNIVQFQKGMSEDAFEAQFGTEDKCWAHLVQWRWPEGFVCPICGRDKYSLLIVGRRRLFQCSHCRTQTSVTAGTIFASTKVPLKKWFRAIYHLTQSKGGISSVELARRLGVTQTTAWKISHKLMQVMLEREHQQRLTGRVEMDDAYLGGKRRGGKRGRGAPGKIPFIAAVETTKSGQPHKMKLCRVKGFRRNEVQRASQKILRSGTLVVTDRLPCFSEVQAAGCRHEPVQDSGRKAVQDSVFKWVNTMLGNVKSALLGTYRAVRGKHVPRYLASFGYRFNRRYDLATMLTRLAWVSLRTPPMPYRLLKLAEDCA